MQIADRIKNIESSSTVKIAAKAIALKEAGREIVDFGVGEPDFPTPDNIKAAAKRAIEDNYTKYTTNNGLLSLRQEICQKLQKENALSFRPEQVLVSNGAKHALFNVMFSIVDPGDEVIIPAPYWSSYPEITKLTGGTPVLVNTTEESGFHISAEQLAAVITDKTKAFILCNPTNPTGAAYYEEHLKQLADILRKREIYVITDEIYEKLFYDNQQFTSFAAFKKLKERTIIINGLSKAYAMTGWRIGYAAGPREIIEAAAKIQSHSTSAASTLSQYAAIEALQGPQEELRMMVGEFERRRNFAFTELQKILAISCAKPGGAFYLFPNISAFFGTEFNGRAINSSVDMANYLLEEAGVVFVPGSGFGAEGFLRLSYANSMDQIKLGMRNINDALSRLT